MRRELGICKRADSIQTKMQARLRKKLKALEKLSFWAELYEYVATGNFNSSKQSEHSTERFETCV